MAVTRNIPKFILNDFELAGDTNRTNLKDLYLVLKFGNHKSTGILISRDIKQLLEAKKRRHPDYFNGIFISGNHDEDKDTGKCKKLLELAQAIYSGEASRTQVIYRSNFKRHYFSFDIQLNENKELSIFTIDSSLDNCQSKVIDALLLSLASLNIPAKGYATRFNFQTDGINCAFYAYAIISELAKIATFHQDLINYPQGSEPALSEKSDCKLHTVVSPVIWIKASAVPLKIITMTQSYNRMLSLLTERMPKAEADNIIANHKKKYAYNEKQPHFYYINKRKQTIANHLSLLMWETGGFENPILQILEKCVRNKELIVKNDIINVMSGMVFQKKIITYITAVNDCLKFLKFDGIELRRENFIFRLRDILVELLSVNRPVGIIPKFAECTLIDGPFNGHMEFIPEEEEKGEYRELIDALANGLNYKDKLDRYQRANLVREKCITNYMFDRFTVLRKTTVEFINNGETKTMKMLRLIENLSEDQLKQFFEKYPDKKSLSNLKDAAVYLKSLLYGAKEDDMNTVNIIRDRSIAPISDKVIKKINLKR